MPLPQDCEITIQTLAMPADTNANGDIFGGWLLSQMDLASGILAKKISCGRIVPVAINSMCFMRPVQVGDVVSCYTKLLKKGRSSLDIQVDVWVTNQHENAPHQVTTGTFVCVAIDDSGKPRKISSTQAKP
jgi:acyl-CoA thioesterase YciA